MIKVDFELRFGVTIFASQNEAQLCVRQNRVRSLFFFIICFVVVSSRNTTTITTTTSIITKDTLCECNKRHIIKLNEMKQNKAQNKNEKEKKFN